MRKLIGLLIVIAMLAASIGIGAYKDFPEIKIRDAEGFNFILGNNSLLNQDPDPAEPGKKVDVRFKIENVGRGVATDFVFEIVPKYPFSLPPGEPAQTRIGDLNSRQIGSEAYVVKYTLLIDKDAIEGRNEIDLRYSTNNGASWVRVPALDIQLKIHEAILAIDKVVYSPEVVSPGDTTTVSITLTNAAQTLLKDIKVKLDLITVLSSATSVTQEEIPLTPIGTSNENVIRNLEAGASETMQFVLQVDADAASKVHKIPMIITYTDNGGRNYSRTNIIGVQVSEQPAFILNLEETDIYTKSSKGKMLLSVTNIGSSDIKFASLELLPGKEYEILSSNRVYLGNIESDDFEDAEFEIFARGTNGKIPLNIRLEYQDAYNQEKVEDMRVELRLFPHEEAVRYGLVKVKSKAASIISAVILVLLTVFWLFMLMDCIRTKRMRYKKILWLVLVIFTYVLGATIYYLIGRKRGVQ